MKLCYFPMFLPTYIILHKIFRQFRRVSKEQFYLRFAGKFLVFGEYEGGRGLRREADYMKQQSFFALENFLVNF